MTQSKERLEQFLELRQQHGEVTLLTADASTREYFRIPWNGRSAIACVYPEPFDAEKQNYLDVTRLFLSVGLPVAEVYDKDGELGVIVEEDLGDTILRDVLIAGTSEENARLRNEAITLIARIQATTPKAREMHSVAATLKFDTEKLLWELNYFKEHYFTTYLGRPLSADDDAVLTDEFKELAGELEKCATVLCHRDFHAANLMLDPKGKMRIIDHQDARIGSPAYDLVSLLLDRITEVPTREWLADRRKYFLNVRVTLGLGRLDEEEFAQEFRLQTIQRCLKAAGTFSFQSATCGKTYFIPFIEPMFRISIRGAESLGRFPAIRRIIGREIGASHA